MAAVAKVGGTRRVAGPILKGRMGVEYEGNIWKASRLSFHLNCHHVPKTPPSRKEGLVLHTCDNEWCVEPGHLYLGTAQRNTLDIYERNPNIRARMSESRKGNANAKGSKRTAEWRRKRSESLIGNARKLGKKETLETRIKKSNSAAARWARHKEAVR